MKPAEANRFNKLYQAHEPDGLKNAPPGYGRRSIERNEMLQWIIENKTWLFSGLAVAIPIAVIGWIISRPRNRTVQKQKSGSRSVNIQAGEDVSLGERKNHE